MSQTLGLLTQLANGFAKQFGPDCEIIIHVRRKQLNIAKIKKSANLMNIRFAGFFLTPILWLRVV